MLVFLIGFMGSGKTSTGIKLAKKLELDFIDLDKFIEEKHHKSLALLFSENGESFFRESERQVLHDCFILKDTLISCGGGTPCFYDNMNQMNSNGITIYLKLSARSLFHRLAQDKEKRPLIAGKSDLVLMDYIEKELQSREQFYNQAKITVKGESLKTETLVELLLNFEQL